MKNATLGPLAGIEPTRPESSNKCIKNDTRNLQIPSTMSSIRVRSLQDQKYSKTFKDFFRLFSKTFQRL